MFDGGELQCMKLGVAKMFVFVFREDRDPYKDPYILKGSGHELTTKFRSSREFARFFFLVKTFLSYESSLGRRVSTP